MARELDAIAGRAAAAGALANANVAILIPSS